MIPPVTDTDPDPTSQIPWPSARPRQLDRSDSSSSSGPESSTLRSDGDDVANGEQVPGKRRLTTWDLITLSISMAGAQIAWTVELGYGTPFLLNLGLSEQLTSLVWLAGPISGLVAQPVIGAVSDSSTSKYRRRFWIILSTIALVISTLTLAYCIPLAEFWVDLFAVGSGDWDETRKERARNVSIAFAVISFYVLDFALNGLQASLRNLLLDIAPPNQLNAGNAWHSRMTNAGNIIGYGFGFLPLAELPIIRLIKGSQFRKFCIICIVILVITVAITCICHEEEERPKKSQSNSNSFREIINNIRVAVVNLPRPIRRVCYVQIFAFMGWYYIDDVMLIFFRTTYVGQIMAHQIDQEPDHDLATRKGELAMLIYSVVGVIAGTILPHLANRDRRLLGRKTDVDENAEITRLRGTVRQWKVDAARQGKPLNLPVMPFLLRNIWTGALLLFSFLTFMTFFIETVTQATIFISLVGISWAVAMWVPFAIIMELLKEPPKPIIEGALNARRPSHARNLSIPATSRKIVGERTALLRRHSLNEVDVVPEEDEVAPTTSFAGGTVLGIHNLAIVAPQFIVAVINSIIFRIVDESGKDLSGGGNTGEAYYGKTGVGWVLRFGGLCTLFGAVVARMVPPTPTEREMRRRLGEMQLLGEEPAP
ncbi:MFS general substrate transporter [Macrolepiota fuliginosa MF-IS2]|uniref:MFS general substrate transporter n=1 Tax=Macrolepiota fuliginosa MF-IS2 TaxID=1400762 RepID=A0A9P6C4U0_9AGAR|nr:MFS general substrate transporter [Macrolepiota fuliginosa MF-IS2]